MACTMKVSCKSSMAPSIQLLKGAARLAYSKYSWSMVSRSFSVRWECQMGRGGEVLSRVIVRIPPPLPLRSSRLAPRGPGLEAPD